MRAIWFLLVLVVLSHPATLTAQQNLAKIDSSPPKADQTNIKDEYKLTPEDLTYIPMTRRIEVLPELRKMRLSHERVANLDYALLVGPDDEVVVSMGDMIRYLWASGKEEDPVRMIMFRPDLVWDAVREAANVKFMGTEALEKGFDKDEGVAVDMRFIRQRVLRPFLFQYAYVSRGERITDQMVQLQYERDRMTKHRTAMGFEVRQIFLMAYVPYTVTAEDKDLRDIATRVSGNEGAVVDIRTDDDKKRRRWVPEAQRTRLAYEELSAGEKLLVPMDEGGIEKLAGVAREIYQRLEAGEDFVTLATEFSSDAKPGEVVTSSQLFGDNRILPEIVEAIKATEPGGFTPFVRTKHGFQCFLVVTKRPETFTPFDDAAPSIRRQLESAAMNAAAASFTEDLQSSPTAQVNADVLLNSEGKSLLEGDTLLATVDGQPLTYDDIFANDQMRNMFREASPEQRLKMLKDSRPFMDRLYERFAADHGMLEVPAVKERLDYYRTFAMTKRYGAEIVHERYRETTPLLYNFYVENPTIFIQREVYTYRILEKAVPPTRELRDAVVARLKSVKDSVTDEVGFDRAVRAESDNPNHRENGGLNEKVFFGELPVTLRQQFRDAKPGTMIGPLEANGRLMLVYLVGMEKDYMPPFEKAFQKAADEYERRVQENIRKMALIQYLEKNQVRVSEALLSDPEQVGEQGTGIAAHPKKMDPNWDPSMGDPLIEDRTTTPTAASTDAQSEPSVGATAVGE